MNKLFLRILVVIVLVAIFLFDSIVFKGEAQTQGRSIRIALSKNVHNLDLMIKNDYQIVDVITGKLLHQGRRLRLNKIVKLDDGFLVSGVRYTTKHLRIIPRKYFYIPIADKNVKYRGVLDFIDVGDKKFHSVNVLELEKYVQGVLYHEISNKWPMQATMAQAIVVRSYAVYQMFENKDQFFDVTNDVYSQVYGGKSAERYRTNLAVKRTKGVVLMYEGKVLPAYFHSNSGGHTEDVRELWKHDLVPLYGRKSDFSIGMPGYLWKKNIQLKDIQKQFNKKGHNLDRIKDVRIFHRTKSGRVKTLLITTRTGENLEISGKEFRAMMGFNVIRSNLYDVSMRGYFLDIVGRGWGHGVGMCQWGAYNMGKKRFKYKEILSFYYPESVLRNIEKGIGVF